MAKTKPQIISFPTKKPDYNTTFNTFSNDIKNIITGKLKETGYEEWLDDDSLGVEGYYCWWKHPSRVAKIFLSIDSGFTTKGEFKLQHIYVQLSINNAVNTVTEMHEMINDYPETYNSDADLFTIKDINNNTFEFKPEFLKFKILDGIFENIQKLENRIFFDYDKTMNNNQVEAIHGSFDNAGSDFKNWVDYKTWLEWLDIDVTKFAIAKDLIELYPPEAKEIFIF